MSIRLTNTAASAAAGDGSNHGISGYIGSGAKLKFYAGAVNTAPEVTPAGTLLATVTAGATFGTASSGIITCASWVNGTATTGTPACFVLTLSGDTPVCDGTVGLTSGYDINFDNVTWLTGGAVAVSTFALTVPPQ